MPIELFVYSKYACGTNTYS